MGFQFSSRKIACVVRGEMPVHSVTVVLLSPFPPVRLAKSRSFGGCCIGASADIQLLHLSLSLLLRLLGDDERDQLFHSPHWQYFQLPSLRLRQLQHRRKRLTTALREATDIDFLSSETPVDLGYDMDEILTRFVLFNGYQHVE